MFQQASRIKLRFATAKGLLTVEDLWDLPLTSTRGAANLDDIAIGLRRQLKDKAEESFVVKPARVLNDDVTQLTFDIVKLIIDTRLAENEAANNAKAKAEKKQELLALIKQKEGEQVAGKSLDELRLMVEALQ